jgi:hypothetical protein
MEWLSKKTLRPRKKIEIDAFGVPQLQLGDIVNISYVLPEGLNFVDNLQQFVVSDITYSRSTDGVSSIIKVVEI